MLTVLRSRCGTCGGCVAVCPAFALTLAESWLAVDSGLCTSCGACLAACPVGALTLTPEGWPAAPPSPLSKAYDVVVIGAGPAGSMAALAAARGGASVLLAEKRQEIGSPVRCAEGVGHELLTRFVEPDSRWISATVTSASITTVTGADRREVLRRSGSTGYILERRIFDRVLAENAASAGARVVTKAPATGLITEYGRTVGVRLSWRGAAVDVRSSVVIAADGVESLVARWAGLSTDLPLHDTMSCAQYLLTGIDLDPECCAYFVGDDVAPGGYVWVFPKGPDRANVGLGVQADLGGPPAVDLLQRFVESTPALARGSIVTQVFGVVPVAAPLARPFSDGLIVAGDAARQVDALTGGGITNAMLAGELAGRTAVRACQEKDVLATRLSDYGQALEGEMGRRLARNYRLKERYGAAARVSDDFLKVFALAAAGT